MKNFLSIIVLCFFGAALVQAQEQTFGQNDNVVNLGVGIGGTLYNGLGYTGSGIKRMPTFFIAYERCVVGKLFNDKSSLGVGGLGGYTSAKYDYSGWGWKSTDIMIGARAALHYAFVDKLDTYGGCMFGYNINSWKWTGVTGGSERRTGNNGLTYSIFVGGRYYLGNAFAVFAELGYGYSVLNAGLSFKF